MPSAPQRGSFTISCVMMAGESLTTVSTFSKFP